MSIVEGTYKSVYLLLCLPFLEEYARRKCLVVSIVELPAMLTYARRKYLVVSIVEGTYESVYLLCLPFLRNCSNSAS